MAKTLAELRAEKAAVFAAERAFRDARDAFLNASAALAAEACPYKVGDRVTAKTFDGYVEGEVLEIRGDGYALDAGWIYTRRLDGKGLDVEPYVVKVAPLTTKGKIHPNRVPHIYEASHIKGLAADFPAARLNKEAAAARAAAPLRVT